MAPGTATVTDSQPPPNHQKEICQVNASLALNIATWLRKRGKTVRPKLTNAQKRQLKECFELMDADGSGAIDADELYAAFQLLGLNLKMHEVESMLVEVNRGASDEVGYPEFLEIMTSTLTKLSEDNEAAAQSGNTSSKPGIPFSLMATAYRRKRLMEGLITRDKEMQAQIALMADELAEKANEGSKTHPNHREAGPPHSTDSRCEDDIIPEPLYGEEEDKILATMLPERLRNLGGASSAPLLANSPSPLHAGELPGRKSKGFLDTHEHKQLMQQPKAGGTFSLKLRAAHGKKSINFSVHPTNELHDISLGRFSAGFQNSMHLLNRSMSRSASVELPVIHKRKGHAVRPDDRLVHHSNPARKHVDQDWRGSRSAGASPIPKRIDMKALQYDRSMRDPPVSVILPPLQENRPKNTLSYRKRKADISRLLEDVGNKPIQSKFESSNCNPLIPSNLQGDIHINKLHEKSILSILAR